MMNVTAALDRRTLTGTSALYVSVLSNLVEFQTGPYNVCNAVSSSLEGSHNSQESYAPFLPQAYRSPFLAEGR
jgi:hypothetical protein